MDQSNCTDLFHATNGSNPIDMVTDTSNGTYLSENPVGMDIGIYLNESAANANIGIFEPEELMQSDSSCHTSDISMDVSDMPDYQMELASTGSGKFLVVSCEAYNTDDNLVDMAVDSQSTESSTINNNSHLNSNALVADSNGNTVATAASSKPQTSSSIIPDLTVDHDYVSSPSELSDTPSENSSTPSASPVPVESPTPLNSTISMNSSPLSNPPEQPVLTGPAESPHSINRDEPLNSSISSASSNASALPVSSALSASSMPSLSPMSSNSLQSLNPSTNKPPSDYALTKNVLATESAQILFPNKHAQKVPDMQSSVALPSLSPSTSTNKPPSDYALTRNVLVKEAAEILLSNKHVPKVPDIQSCIAGEHMISWLRDLLFLCGKCKTTFSMRPRTYSGVKILPDHLRQLTKCTDGTHFIGGHDINYFECYDCCLPFGIARYGDMLEDEAANKPMLGWNEVIMKKVNGKVVLMYGKKKAKNSMEKEKAWCRKYAANLYQASIKNRLRKLRQLQPDLTFEHEKNKCADKQKKLLAELKKAESLQELMAKAKPTQKDSSKHEKQKSKHKKFLNADDTNAQSEEEMPTEVAITTGALDLLQEEMQTAMLVEEQPGAQREMQSEVPIEIMSEIQPQGVQSKEPPDAQGAQPKPHSEGQLEPQSEGQSEAQREVQSEAEAERQANAQPAGQTEFKLDSHLQLHIESNSQSDHQLETQPILPEQT